VPSTGGWTRFAPAPTGYLHLGHVANAIWVWGLAEVTESKVILRIEDHDRERCRPEFDVAILEDLDWLGFVADAGPVRQSADPAPYRAALDRLRDRGLVYACDCARSTFAAWTAHHGHRWQGPGCPGDCRARALDDDGVVALRVALGAGSERWSDLLLGPRSAEASPSGDLAIRDRHGNWTYGFAVVLDDMRQSVSLIVRGEDLLEVTAGQIRLGHLLGRPDPPLFAHHPLIRKPGGQKLSKADGDTGVRDLRSVAASPADVIGWAAGAIGLIPKARPVPASEVGALVRDAIRPTRSPA
jgi:glutamyl-Q tRNA(Asp) synthetase